MKAHLVDARLPAVSVVAKHTPRSHISIRVGPVCVTATVDEALRLAHEIADAVATLRAAYPKENHR